MQTAVITVGHDVAVNIKEITDHDMSHFARSTLEAVERFFDMPGVREDYEKWLVKYQKRRRKKHE